MIKILIQKINLYEVCTIPFTSSFFSNVLRANLEVDSSNTFNPTELKEDWNIFRKALTDAHPAVYRYISEQNLNIFFDSVATSFKYNLSEIDFTRLLMMAVAKIRCVHTGATFSDDYYINRPITKNTILPLNFMYINGEAYIKKNTSRDSVSNIIGLKVDSINGFSMEFFREKFFPILNGDGYIQTSRYNQLGNDFNHLYNNFIGRSDTFYLDCEDPSSKELVEIKVAAITIKEVIDRENWRSRGSKILSYKILDGNIAYIQMDNFLLQYLRRKKQAPYKFLRTTFRDINKKNIQHVIIDIRNNGGGHGEYGAKLFSYLRDSSFRSDQSQIVKRIKFHNEYIQYRAKHQHTALKSSSVTKTDSGYYAVKNRFTGLLKPVRPARNPFKGQAYLLISGSTYSAASHFAATFNTYDRGPIIGQETGGQSYGPNGYWRLRLILPHTKTKIHIPLVSTHHYVKSYTYGRGIMPTHEIDDLVRIRGLIENFDPELEFTLKLIAGNK